MNTILLALTLFAAPATTATEPEGMLEAYTPSKMVKEKANLYCQALASVSVHFDAQQSIVVHTEPKIMGVTVEGRRAVAVMFPYRTDGVAFACVFFDYANGLLQLFEFGHVGKDVDDITTVKLLY